MKASRRLGFLTVTFVLATTFGDENTCMCPTEHKPKHPVVYCGKEINYIYNNKNCEQDAQYNCKGAGVVAVLQSPCFEYKKVCGRDYGPCSTEKSCYWEQFSRMCYFVDKYNRASSKCHSEHYTLNDKGKLCCDQEPPNKVNPKIVASCYS